MLVWQPLRALHPPDRRMSWQWTRDSSQGQLQAVSDFPDGSWQGYFSFPFGTLVRMEPWATCLQVPQQAKGLVSKRPGLRWKPGWEKWGDRLLMALPGIWPRSHWGQLLVPFLWIWVTAVRLCLSCRRMGSLSLTIRRALSSTILHLPPTAHILYSNSIKLGESSLYGSTCLTIHHVLRAFTFKVVQSSDRLTLRAVKHWDFSFKALSFKKWIPLITNQRNLFLSFKIWDLLLVSGFSKRENRARRDIKY